jgi:hypothetical protein
MESTPAADWLAVRVGNVWESAPCEGKQDKAIRTATAATGLNIVIDC